MADSKISKHVEKRPSLSRFTAKELPKRPATSEGRDEEFTREDRVRALRRALHNGKMEYALKQWLAISMDAVLENEDAMENMTPKDIEGIIRSVLAYKKESRENRKERRLNGQKSQDDASDRFLERLESINGD